MKRILIIDDSEANLLLIESIFEGNNHVEVHIEKNSTHAMVKIKKLHPDLIVLDLMMPRIDGFEILEKIRTDNQFNKVKILVLSAKQDAETINLTKKMGCDDFMKKPVDLSLIENKIIEMLEI